MRARTLHSRDQEGSPLEYGLDYSLRQLKNAVEKNEGVDRDPESQLQKVTEWLDCLREFRDLFCQQLGYLT